MRIVSIISATLALVSAQHDMGSGMADMSGYDGMGGMDIECCPMKKIWGSMDPMMDGVYTNVGKLPYGSLPRRCNSPCVYERKGSDDGLQFCFGDSMYSQAQCEAGYDGEEPVDMGSGGENPVDMGSGEDPVNMGSGSEDGSDMESSGNGSSMGGSGSGSDM